MASLSLGILQIKDLEGVLDDFDEREDDLREQAASFEDKRKEVKVRAGGDDCNCMGPVVCLAPCLPMLTA